jgi:SnoaL-like protein
MADARTTLTPQQKIEIARKALDEANQGKVNPEGFAPNAVMHGSLVPEVRGRDAVVAALKQARSNFDEFRQEPHAILADNDHVVALINLKVKTRRRTVEGQQVLVVHTNDQGQITEMWGMIEPETLKRIQGS